MKAFTLMASPADFLQQARDFISTNLYGANHRGEMISDYGTDADAFNSGETQYQIRLWVQSTSDINEVNAVYKRIGVEVQVYHASIFPGNESGYTGGAMLTNQLALLDLTAWRNLSTVFDVDEDPEISSSPTMDGNVINYTMSLSVRLT